MPRRPGTFPRVGITLALGLFLTGPPAMAQPPRGDGRLSVPGRAGPAAAPAPDRLTLEEVRALAEPDTLELTNGQRIRGYIASEGPEGYEVYVPTGKGGFLRSVVRPDWVARVAYAPAAARAAMRQKVEWWRARTPDYAKWDAYNTTYLSDWYGLQGWRVQGKFFTLETDFPEAAALAFTQRLDTIYPEYCRVWQVEPRTPKFIRARVFRDGDDYVRVLQREGVKREHAHNSAGMFVTKYRIVFVRDYPAKRGEPKRSGLHPSAWGTLLHECHHAFVYREILKNGRRPPLPIWVEEGLAEYFEHSDMVDGQLRPGHVPAKSVAKLRAALTAHTFIPLTRLLRVTAYDQVDNGVAYAEYWALVHYLEREGLVRGRGGWSRFAGRWDMDSLTTFQDMVGMPAGQFEPAWRRYIAELGS